MKFKPKTLGGFDVRIYATDGRGTHPLHGACFINGEWRVACWREDGRFHATSCLPTDLIPDMPEPLEFEPTISDYGGWNYSDKEAHLGVYSSRSIEEIVEAKEEVNDKTKEELEQALAEAREVIEFYGDFLNYSLDYETSAHGFSRRCILYSDIEERNEATGLAGKRAREWLKRWGG